MRGVTHALGGAATLAAFTLATGEAVPAWGYGLAALAALVPDADNGRGSILNRPHLLPAKLMTVPVWYGASHRGRSHSLAGTAIFLAVLAAWAWAAGWAAAWAHVPNPFANPVPLLVAGGLGYLSHIVLDLFNQKDEQLLWPLPGGFRSPWGVSASGTADWLLHGALVVFLCWFGVSWAGAIAHASLADPATQRLPGFALALAGGAITALRGLLGGARG